MNLEMFFITKFLLSSLFNFFQKENGIIRSIVCVLKLRANPQIPDTFKEFVATLVRGMVTNLRHVKGQRAEVEKGSRG